MGIGVSLLAADRVNGLDVAASLTWLRLGWSCSSADSDMIPRRSDLVVKRAMPGSIQRSMGQKSGPVRGDIQWCQNELVSRNTVFEPFLRMVSVVAVNRWVKWFENLDLPFGRSIPLTAFP